jgi:hypothetical protein
MAPCFNCAGTGFCPACSGNGLVIQRHTIDMCSTCQGSGRTGMAWCAGCGGSGRQLLYEELVACDECIGDGSCVCLWGRGVMIKKNKDKPSIEASLEHRSTISHIGNETKPQRHRPERAPAQRRRERGSYLSVYLHRAEAGTISFSVSLCLYTRGALWAGSPSVVSSRSRVVVE